MMTLLTVDGINVSRGEVRILRDVSLSVEAGEMVSILGANGAGKTTLLRCISGLLRAAHGSIKFNGQEISGARPHMIARSGLLHVPEGRGILAELSVAENLAVGRLFSGSLKSRYGIDALFKIFPVLSKKSRQEAKMLSGGEQQMLAIARSLLGQPKLLAIDELSLGLAPKVTTELMRFLGNLRDEGYAILLVEQNAHQALKFSDRAYVLANGRIAMSGKCDELAADTGFISAYLGGDH
jgi:branched-chain amino acid transport system ATP-binding protein